MSQPSSGQGILRSHLAHIDWTLSRSRNEPAAPSMTFGRGSICLRKCSLWQVCLCNVSGMVHVIWLLLIELTITRCIASRWDYKLISNLLEMADGLFWNNMQKTKLFKFQSLDSWLSNQPCDWNAIGDCHSSLLWSLATLLWGDICHQFSTEVQNVSWNVLSSRVEPFNTP